MKPKPADELAEEKYPDKDAYDTCSQHIRRAYKLGLAEGNVAGHASVERPYECASCFALPPHERLQIDKLTREVDKWKNGMEVEARAHERVARENAQLREALKVTLEYLGINTCRELVKEVLAKHPAPSESK